MLKEFANEEMKQFKDLSPDEMHCIVKAKEQGLCGCYDAYKSEWYIADKNNAVFNLIYRTKPKPAKKLDIPWHVVDKRWKYTALDYCGDIIFYSHEPYYEAGIWFPKEGSACNAECLAIDTTDIVAETSLTERPEGV